MRVPDLLARLWGGVLRHWSTRRLEWILAAILLAQSLQLLSAHDLATNRIYRILATLVRERTLGHAAMTMAWLWLTALFLNGTFVAFRRISPWLRASLSLAAACYWTLWAITLFAATGPVTSVSWINHGGLAALALLCFLQSAHEVAVQDERAAACRRRTSQRPF